MYFAGTERCGGPDILGQSVQSLMISIPETLIRTGKEKGISPVFTLFPAAADFSSTSGYNQTYSAWYQGRNDRRALWLL
jgi:hypothetical protein